ncbi:MAG: hypothetical protein AAGA21_06295 [Pseudomonadota bacterium]
MMSPASRPTHDVVQANAAIVWINASVLCAVALKRLDCNVIKLCGWIDQHGFLYDQQAQHDFFGETA